jgi:hypothetical protein
MLTSKLSLLLFSSLLFVGLAFTAPRAKADCPDGTIFVADGNFSCWWYLDNFECVGTGTCENNCGAYNACVYSADKLVAKEEPLPTVVRIPVPIFIK